VPLDPAHSAGLAGHIPVKRVQRQGAQEQKKGTGTFSALMEQWNIGVLQ